MNKETIYKDVALNLLAKAKKNAERMYKGDRLKGVLAGLGIAENLIGSMEPVDEGAENDG